MRNGNSVPANLITDTFESSYPTYEEWKPGNALLSSQRIFSSYPTYEEWKLSS